MRRLIPLLAALLLLCGCTKKNTQYFSPNAKNIRDAFSALQPDRQSIAETEPPEDAPVVTPLVPFQ